ncbi:MAG TPA: biopolymer transporter ExbD [Oceanipulchritudo sp.]|nr:biopolymer transporter ExbD [Oceanipulchritudo sp.]
MAGLTQPLEFRKFIRSAPQPGFDVVPFLDAILIALFVALNASVFVLAPGTIVHLPQSDTLEAAQSAPTAVLTVDRNELYFFKGRKLAKVSLEGQLRQYIEDLGPKHQESGAVLLLKADSSITSATLFSLMDTARKAGFSQIHLAAELKPGTQVEWNDRALE